MYGLVEIGGKNKRNKQIKGVNKAYIFADNILYPDKNKIPLWLLGMID